MCSAILVSGSNMLKHQRPTHFLNTGSALLISGTQERDSLSGCGSSIFVSGSYLPKHKRETHSLDASSAILVSDSHLLKQGATHKLDACSTIFVSGSHL